MNEKSSCPVLRGRDSGTTVLLLDNLFAVDLRDADLKDATNITTEELKKAKSLEGTIMPDGSKHL